MRDNSLNNWPRIIVLVDMDCFFAQIEQKDYAHCYQRPVVVTNGRLGCTIITSSYEARAFGIKTGMKLYDARKLCPNLIHAPSRPERYAAISTTIMQALKTLTPDVEVFSVDEAFLDMTHCRQLYQDVEQIGRLVRERVYAASGLTCSIGISGDKTTAKFAAKLQKPKGLTIIPPWESEARLSNELVTALSGINQGISGFLAKYGVVKCGDMKRLPMGILGQRYGHLGRRIWLMAQGKDPAPVISVVKAPKSLGHGKRLPSGSRGQAILLIYLQHMAEKVGMRLRAFGLRSDEFFIGIKTVERGYLTTKKTLEQPTDDGQKIYQLCRDFIKTQYRHETCRQVQITAINPLTSKQLDLFSGDDTQQKRHDINAVVDGINQKFGEFTIAPTRLLGRSEMPNVIAPAWQPEGHRKSI